MATPDLIDPFDAAGLVDPFANPPAANERGFVGDVGSHLARGTVNAAGQVGGMITELGAPTVGDAIYDWSKKKQRDTAFLQPDTSETNGKDGYLYQGLMGAVESTPASAIPFIAGAAGAAAAPALGVAAGVGATVAGTTALLGTFGLGTFHQSRLQAEEFLAQNRPELSIEERKQLALTKGLTDSGLEAGTELAADAFMVLTFGGGAAFKQPLKQTLKALLSPESFVKAYLKNAPVETGTEMLSAWGQAHAAQDINMPTPTPLDAAGQAILPSLFMSLGFGGAIHGYSSIQAKALLGGLNATDPEIRKKATSEVTKNLLSVAPDEQAVALKWFADAHDKIKKGEKINIDARLGDFADQKLSEEENPPPQDEAGLKRWTDAEMVRRGVKTQAEVDAENLTLTGVLGGPQLSRPATGEPTTDAPATGEDMAPTGQPSGPPLPFSPTSSGPAISDQEAADFAKRAAIDTTMANTPAPDLLERHKSDIFANELMTAQGESQSAALAQEDAKGPQANAWKQQEQDALAHNQEKNTPAGARPVVLSPKTQILIQQAKYVARIPGLPEKRAVELMTLAADAQGGDQQAVATLVKQLQGVRADNGKAPVDVNETPVSETQPDLSVKSEAQIAAIPSDNPATSTMQDMLDAGYGEDDVTDRDYYEPDADPNDPRNYTEGATNETTTAPDPSGKAEEAATGTTDQEEGGKASGGIAQRTKPARDDQETPFFNKGDKVILKDGSKGTISNVTTFIKASIIPTRAGVQAHPFHEHSYTAKTANGDHVFAHFSQTELDNSAGPAVKNKQDVKPGHEEVGHVRRIADSTARLVQSHTFGGVNYQLWESDNHAITRVFDLDSGNTVSLKKTPDKVKGRVGYKVAIQAAEATSDKPEASTARRPLPQKSLDLFNAAFEAKDVAKMKEMVHPKNKGWRAMFEERTGTTLPKGVEASEAVVGAWSVLDTGKAAARKEWFINVDDKPVLTTKDDAVKSGMRGPYSALEAAELTGTDQKAMEADAAPVTPSHGKLTEKVPEDWPRYHAEGAAAFAAGTLRQLPRDFTGGYKENAKAWFRGWDEANMAEPLPGSKTPSLRDLSIRDLGPIGSKVQFVSGFNKDILTITDFDVDGKVQVDGNKNVWRFPSDFKKAETNEAPAHKTIFTLAEFLQKYIDGTETPFASIVQARKAAAEHMGATAAVAETGEFKKQVEEAMELAIVTYSRATIAKMRKMNATRAEIFQLLQEIYENQPNLGTRTSGSVQRQAYSTPVPLAFLASELAGITDQTTVYEPTAGTGLLLIGANPGRVRANELDDVRSEILNYQNLAVVTQNDATTNDPGTGYDVVIENPPFGKVLQANGQDTMWTIDGFNTREIDHAIVLKSLQAMRDNGRAVLIIGGLNKQITSEVERAQRYNSGALKNFYSQLYNAYNVIDHFTVAGSLYQKQGAAWPVDVIVIQGKGQSSQALPGFAAPPIYHSFDEFGRQINEQTPHYGVATTRAEQDATDFGAHTGTPATTGPYSRPLLGGDNEQGGSPDSQGAGQAGSPDGSGVNAGETRPDAGGIRTAGEPGGPDTGAAGAGSDAAGQPGSGNVVAGPDGRTDQGTEAGNGRPGSGADVSGADVGGLAGSPGPDDIRTGIEDELDSLSDDDLNAMFDEVATSMEGETIEPPAPPILGEGSPDITTPAEHKIPIINFTRDYDRTPADFTHWWQERNRVGGNKNRRAEKAETATQKNTPLDKAPQKLPPRTPADALKDAGRNALKSMEQGLKGLDALFGAPDTLRSGMTFDEDSYKKAKPAFALAWEHAKQVGYHMKEFMKLLMERYGTRVKAYVIRFAQDVRAENKKQDEKKAPVASDGQTLYQPASKSGQIGSLVPANMADSIQGALKRLQDEHGDIDSYVANALQYKSTEEMSQYLAAEQIDALALIFDNFAKGQGFILGDQTGIGKGRVVAATIRFSLLNGLTPVFMTEKVQLYKDMYRDLVDIGMGDNIHDQIMMTNSNQIVNLSDEDGGPVMRTPSSWAKTLKDLPSGNLPPGKKIVFTTYDQLNIQYVGTSSVPAPRREFMQRLMSNGNVNLIMDEAHNAGGSGDMTNLRPNRNTGVMPAPRALFIRQLLPHANAVLYSSATYAKNPDVMDLYSATDLKLGVGGDIQRLAATVQQGGIPFQQITASMLAKAGQYIRRERSFDGVAYDPVLMKVDSVASEAISASMTKIREFEDEIMVPWFDDNGGQIASGMGAGGEKSQNFTSLMHNLLDQMLLSLKTQAVIDETLKVLDAGKDGNEQVVITMANTMGSFLADYSAEHDLKEGDPINLSFNDLVYRYLWNTRRYLVDSGKGDGTKDQMWVSDQELGEENLARFDELARIVYYMKLGEMPVSPVDYMHQKLREKGITTAEITGRTDTIDYSGDVPRLGKRSPKDRTTDGKNKTIRRFNTGDARVVILNRSGSTGISLHASERNPLPGRGKRTMIIAQAEKDINTHMQMLGRVHRTGQVVTPRYIQAVADIPAEKKPAAVLLSKMASLNANTTAAADSVFTDKTAVNFFNRYGDLIVAQTILANPVLNRQLGNPIRTNDQGAPITLGAAKKVTGRLPLLPAKVQEEIYAALTDGYNDYIAELDARGMNDLEAKTFDLQAETTATREIKPNTGESPFQQSVAAETVTMKRIGIPMSTIEVKDLVIEHLGEEKAMVDGMERFRIYAAKEMSEADAKVDNAANEVDAHGADDTRNLLRTRLHDNQAAFSGLQQMIKVGATIRVDLNTGLPGDEDLYGVVVGIEQKGTPRNPLALGSWRVKLAVADGLRHIQLPLSRLGTNDGQIVLASARTAHGMPIMDYFDHAKSQSTEVRTIVTGNLFSGYNDMAAHNGRIINYTKKDGTQTSGILMPRGFDTETAMNSTPVSFNNAEHVIAFLKKTEPLRVYLNLPGNLRLALVGGDYAVTTDSAARTAGRFFKDDRELLAITGEFHSRGNLMVTDKLTEKQARRVAELFVSRGNSWEAKEALEEARRIQNGQNAAPAGPVLMRRGELTDRQDKSIGQEAVQQVADQYNSIFTNGPQVQVVSDINKLPPRAKRHMMRAGVGRVGGIFDSDTGQVWLVAGNIHSSIEAGQTVLHEVVAHFGLRALLGGKHTPFLKDVGRYMDPARLKAIAKKYDLDLGNGDHRLLAIEEEIARMAETGDKPSLMRRIIVKVREILRAAGFVEEWTDNDIKGVLRQARAFVEGRSSQVAGKGRRIAPLFSLNGGDLQTRINELQAQVDAAYEAGDHAKAETLDAQLEGLHEDLAAQESENVDGEDHEAEADLHTDLAKRYAELFHPLPGHDVYSGLTQQEKVDSLRGVAEEYAWKHGGMKEGVTDEQVLAAGKDAYDSAKTRRGALQTKTVKENSTLAGQPLFRMSDNQTEAQQAATTAQLISDSEAEANRLQAVKIWEKRDTAQLVVNRTTAELQRQIQRLAGSVRSKVGPFAYRAEHDSMAARRLDEAMLVYRDIKAFPAKIAEYRAWAEQRLAGEIGNQERSRIKKNIQTLLDVEALTAEQRAFVDTTGELAFSEISQLSLQKGIVKTLRENYVRRLWSLTPEQEASVGILPTSKNFSTFTTAKMKRTLDTVVDGWMEGYELKVKGISNSFDQIGREVVTIAANQNFIQELKGITDAEGRPLLTTSKMEGYKPLTASGFNVWTHAGEVKGLTNEWLAEFQLEVNNFGQKVFIAPPSDVNSLGEETATVFEKKPLQAPAALADMINKMTQGDSLFNQTPALKGLLRFNAALKSYILLSSFFHHLAGARSWIFGVDHGWKGGAWNPVKSYKEGLKKVDALHPLIMLGVKNGLTLGLAQDFDEGMMQGKGYTQGFLEKHGMEKSLAVLEKASFQRQKFTSSLFSRYFAGLKAEAFVLEYSKGLAKDPTQDKNRLAERVATLLNDDFGGLHLKRWGRNPTLQKVARLFMLAPDWTESNFRAFFGMWPGNKLNAQINRIIGDVPPPPGMPPVYRHFWAKVGTRAAMATIMVQLLLNGDDPDDLAQFYKEQFSSWDRFIRLRWTTVDITKLYKMAGVELSEGERKGLSIVGHFTDPLKLMDPLKLIKGKGSPFVKIVESGFSASDYAERPFTGARELFTTGATVKQSRFQEKENFPNRILSTFLNDVISMQPIQLGHAIKVAQGETDGLSAIMGSLGIAITHIEKPNMEKEAYKDATAKVRDYINKKKGMSPREARDLALKMFDSPAEFGREMGAYKATRTGLSAITKRENLVKRQDLPEDRKQQFLSVADEQARKVRQNFLARTQ